MNQSEHFRQIRGMQLCKCGIEIPINQAECYQCWRRKTRRAAKLSYAGYFVRPTSWPTLIIEEGD